MQAARNSWAMIVGQGVPPRLLPAGFFCDCFPGPHFEIKMKKEKPKKGIASYKSMQVFQAILIASERSTALT